MLRTVRRRLLYVVGVVLVAGQLTTGGASARASADGPQASYVFSGQELVYAQLPGHLIGIPNTNGRGSKPSTYHVVEQLPDGQRRVLRQFDRFLRASEAHKITIDDDCFANFVPGISASEGWVVVAEDDSEECEPDTEDLTFPLGSKMQAAPVHGPAQTLQTCATADVPAALVDGSDAAYLSCNLDSVIVRDLHRPGVPATSIELAPPLAPAGATPRPSYRVAALAGDYLLVTESSAPNALPLDGTATVYDWRTGRAVITLAGPMALNGTSLDRQGTLVVIQQPPNAPRTSACALTGDETLAWFSPSAPFEHLIDATPCGFAADVSGDMVIFPSLLASHPGANRDVTDEALTALSGTGTRQLVSPEQAGTAQPDGVATFAADGELEVYRSGCGDATQIEFYTLAQVLRGIPATSRCPLVIEPSATRVRDGSIAITLRCPRGCSGHVTLRTSTGTPIPLTPATGYPFELDPGRTTITATPQARASRLLGGINKLIVSIVVQTPGSFPASRLHSGYRVTRRVTLHTKE
jgi:hypothetical protein